MAATHPPGDLPILPYARPEVDEDDIAAVVEVLRSDWLTTGPQVATFEEAFATATGAEAAAAVATGTAALHAMYVAHGLGPGDEVLVPALTFAATANAAHHAGATPVFVDVDPDTLLMDPADAARRATQRTRAIVAVDYAGQPCDYTALGALAERLDVPLLADACHSLGGSLHGRPVGSLADSSAFSFHAVKNLTTGEGGMVTGPAEVVERVRRFRKHGIDRDHRQRARAGTAAYGMHELGWNYRLTDIQCALGLSQLRKLPDRVGRRREIARAYGEALAALPWARPVADRSGGGHAWHLYVVRLDVTGLGLDRDAVLAGLRARGIHANVHYPPVHLHPWYRSTQGTGEGLCPVAERAANEIVSLPMYPGLTQEDVERVVEALRAAAQEART